jgi:hypothetical protein
MSDDDLRVRIAISIVAWLLLCAAFLVLVFGAMWWWLP